MLARIALLLFFPLAALGEPGPTPHEYRVDRSGFPLPTGAIARLGVPPPLSGFAWTLGWTADGSRFVVVNYSGVTVFDAATGHWIESQAIGTEGRSLYTPLSRDGRLLFILNGRTGALYDTATADTRTFTLPAPFSDPDHKVYSLTLAANCRFLAGISAPASSPGVAWRYDLARDRFERILKNRADLHSIRLSPDGRRIFATGGTAEPELTARDVSGKELWTTRLKAIGTLRAVSADGRRLAVSDMYGLTVFDTADGKSLLTIPIDSTTPSGMWGVDLSPDGGRLAMGIERDVAVWDVGAGKIRHRLPHAARMVAFSPDGKSLLTVSAWVQRWDVATGKRAYPMPVLEKPVAPLMLRWSGDGKRLLTVWPGDRRGEEREWKPDVLAVWDVGRMEIISRQESVRSVVEAHLDRSGTTVRAVIGDNSLRLWRVAAPATETTVELKAPPFYIFGTQVVTFFSDGRFIVQRQAASGTVGDLYDPTGRHVSQKTSPSQWGDDWARNILNAQLMRSLPGVVLDSSGKRTDLVTARPLPPLDTHAGQFLLRGPSISGGFALTGCRIQITGPWGGPAVEGLVWDTITGGEVVRLMDRIPDWALAALSSDGRWLAYANGETLEFVDLAHPQDRSRVRLTATDIKAVSFAPDGTTVATAHADGTVLLWHTPSAQQAPWKSEDANRLWVSLEVVDAAAAWQTLWHLLDHPDQATDLLKTRLKPVPALTDTLDQIARLDHPKYAVREAASRELASRGSVVEVDLRKVWDKTTAPEQRERIEALLNKLDPAKPPAGAVLRGLRAVWLLERIGSDDSKRLLATMAGGASGSRVTLEAKAALGRLK